MVSTTVRPGPVYIYKFTRAHSCILGTRDKEYWPDNGREVQAPGAIKARASTHSSLTTNLPSAMEGSPAPADVTSTSIDASGDVGGEDGEDCRLYCYCDKISFGEMIGCDGRDCKREWVRLSYVFSDRAILLTSCAYSSILLAQILKRLQGVCGTAMIVWLCAKSLLLEAERNAQAVDARTREMGHNFPLPPVYYVSLNGPLVFLS